MEKKKKKESIVNFYVVKMYGQKSSEKSKGLGNSISMVDFSFYLASKVKEMDENILQEIVVLQ